MVKVTKRGVDRIDILRVGKTKSDDVILVLVDRDKDGKKR